MRKGMKTKDFKKIKASIKRHKEFIKRKFKVKFLEIFGSYTRGEQTPRSDIDILVEFSTPIDLFEFIKLEDFLSEILDRKVDLVMKGALKARIKKRILQEAVSV